MTGLIISLLYAGDGLEGHIEPQTREGLLCKHTAANPQPVCRSGVHLVHTEATLGKTPQHRLAEPSNVASVS